MESGKQLVVQLPPMRAADKLEFERTVPIWGQQRQVRRNQVQTIGLFALLSAACGPLVTRARKNTFYVNTTSVVPFALLGIAVGHLVGQNLYPNVADNKETRFVKRMWWARKCMESQMAN
eukprot:NODE_4914_length_439_cov_70.594872_g4254_i0.p1 GENE.NODE_4914_length_439_cov_70.594872_g4254_i0~~NODE_4914_length_439_cov_70.594872_g4254_i0.p1  ORF type:complete len:138 (-),score=22.46 NODE_4914_length_439_cov_70.594872_g4254_i0:26-385(-)